ncbi:sugar phosphate isomerase/epimerase family protein [Streptomyces spectabilis]|uniref:Sugar phosphate isomerase/epimerase n=2 Tax=Streptomyces spectabilis TaxID=68270 RepID=A0A5P2XIT1_STRST|nr:TIM barrel protein [Streptomyces spectabilis]MCI3906746.1 sugar phosphate isomerase/epimerase [Streptomyces spectabilis]QEV63554.1 sugar phosphate isomerase/epimerase [Streptomyces spectabilis]
MRSAMELGCVVRSAPEAERAARLPLDYLEIKGDMLCVERGEFAALCVRLRAAGLPFKAMTSPLPRRFKCRVVGPDADHAAALDVFRDMCDRGAALGVRTVVLGSGQARSVPPGHVRGQALGQFRDFLVQAHQVCAEREMTLALEPLNRTETNFVNSCAEAREVVDSLTGVDVRITADCFHIMSEQLPIADDVAAAGAAVGHAHTSSVPRGSGDFHEGAQKEFVAALLAAGHRGGLTVEDDFGDFGREASAAVDVFRRVLASVSGPSMP